MAQDIVGILKSIRAHIDAKPGEFEAYQDYFDTLRLLGKEDKAKSYELNLWLRGETAKQVMQGQDPEQIAKFYELNKKTYLYMAQDDFHSYCIALEWNREPGKRFYSPRMKALRPIVDGLQSLADDKLDLLSVSLPPGIGKALANDTPILTRKGWKEHGDLTVGDEVIGLNGQFKRVIAVHPKCSLDVLIEFTNGEAIQCHENHEWMVYDRARHENREYIAETKRLEKRTYESGGEPGHRGHRYILQMPQAEYVVGEEKKLALSPYILGAWLGDGANRNPRICNAKLDYAIIQRILDSGYSVRWKTEHKTTGVMYYDFDIRKELQRLGMCHSRKTTTKHIPQEYFTSSITQRLELLAGLIDTDGTLSDKKKYHFSTCDEQLKNDFITLISTFGWRASVAVYKPRLSSSGVLGKKDTYVVQFTPDCLIPCALDRKQNKPIKKPRRIAIKSIRRVEPKEGNCITVEGDGMYLAGEKLVPTHNTTLAIFYLTWLAGKFPEKPILGGSHSNSFLQGVYEECLRIMQPGGEYLWNDTFPTAHIVKTNAKDLKIDVDRAQRFSTLQFSSIGSGNAGKVRAENLLYCDDLCSGIEEALSRDRMDTLWTKYTTDLRQRKIGDCKELHIATRWSVHDVLGRLEREYAGNQRIKFIAVPALNENGKSNFDYGASHAGFTTAFYVDMQRTLDDASWRALYMNEPIEREGLLYHASDLRRYFELPKEEPDAVIAICDPKEKGTDFAFLPVAYVYGQDYYIEDCICDNGAIEVLDERMANILIKHKVKSCRFESNSAGWRTAEKVQGRVKQLGGAAHITTKRTTANKETKIIVNSAWVKEHCLFKDETKYRHGDEYWRMVNFLCSYTMAGRNKNDDVPDGMAMFAIFAQGMNGAKVEIGKRLW